MPVCEKAFTLEVDDAASCGSTTDWRAAPGACRPRVQAFNLADWSGGLGCDNTAIAAWDGTFPIFFPNITPGFGEYRIIGYDGVSKFCKIEPIGLFVGFGLWRITIKQPLIPGPATVIFSADSSTVPFSNFDITGTYTKTSGCTGPASLIIEGYQ